MKKPRKHCWVYFHSIGTRECIDCTRVEKLREDFGMVKNKPRVGKHEQAAIEGGTGQGDRDGGVTGCHGKRPSEAGTAGTEGGDLEATGCRHGLNGEVEP